MYIYGCIHHPWLNEHGRALKDHGRAWSELKLTKSNQSRPDKMVSTLFTTFSVILDAKMGARVFDHKQRGA